MSLGSGSEAGVIGVGVAVLLASGTGIVRAASVRGDINIKWSRRVEFAKAALEEKVFGELEGLRSDLATILPEEFDPNFDPAEIITDPAPLSLRAEKTAAYYRISTRMEADLARLLRLGPFAVVGFSLLAITSTLMTLYYAEIEHWGPLGLLGIVLLALSILVLVSLAGMYVALQHRLATAEILAGTGGRGDRGGAE